MDPAHPACRAGAGQRPARPALAILSSGARARAARWNAFHRVLVVRGRRATSTATARWRIAVFRSAAPEGSSISLKTSLRRRSDRRVQHNEHHYDAILDIGGNRRLSHPRRALTPHGRLVIVGGETDGRWLGGTDRQLRAHLLSPLVSQKLGTFISSENAEDQQ